MEVEERKKKRKKKKRRKSITRRDQGEEDSRILVHAVTRNRLFAEFFSINCGGCCPTGEDRRSTDPRTECDPATAENEQREEKREFVSLSSLGIAVDAIN